MHIIIEQREGCWVIVDIVGKRDKMRTVPMPSWSKACLDTWKTAAQLEEGFVFRRVNKGDNLMGESIAPQAIRDIIAGYAEKLENQVIAPHDLRRTFAKLAHKGARQSTKFRCLWDTTRFRRRKNILESSRI